VRVPALLQGSEVKEKERRVVKFERSKIMLRNVPGRQMIKPLEQNGKRGSRQLDLSKAQGYLDTGRSLRISSTSEYNHNNIEDKSKNVKLSP
jgi:hypothetical protein